MRNDRRRYRGRNIRRDEGESNIKNVIYIGGIILALGIIAFIVTVIIYTHNSEQIYGDLGTKELGEIASVQKEEQAEETSSNLGKTIEEAKEKMEQERIEKESEKTTNLTPTPTPVNNKKEEKNTVENTKTGNETKNTEEVKKKELAFVIPVQGEIIKEFAKDNLVYSETLKEWVTHFGIDIKADKTTVVKASEEGTVTAIKNDPRYGTTIIISHEDGFETRYANLLTAEFVNVGEKVKKEQTIGTVGNTGAFEVLDDYHLHFEILKNGEYQDPNIYIN